MSALSWYDYILLVVSIIMILIVVLQSSKEDGMSAFTGEKSDLFANQKQRGLEKAINTTTTVLSPKLLFSVITNIASCKLIEFSSESLSTSKKLIILQESSELSIIGTAIGDKVVIDSLTK